METYYLFQAIANILTYEDGDSGELDKRELTWSQMEIN